MKADPKLGTPDYSQGLGPAVGWTDRAQMDQVGVEICVPSGCYKDVVVTKETALGENSFQLKYYAPDVGVVQVGFRGADKTKETLELIEITKLSPAQMAEAHAQAMEMERRAYEINKNVYGKTSPIEPASGASTGLPAAAATTAGDVVVHASDLPSNALSEFDVWDEAASPGGKAVGTPNTGGHLDPPPENDPHVTFTTEVQAGIPYRCWIHMKVGAPKGESQANMVWVQFTDALDATNTAAYMPDSRSYLTAQGPTQEGWSWVGCDMATAPSQSLVSFQTSGEVTVRIQAGMEGVGFDQFLLSSAQFLQQPPTDAVVAK